MNNYVDNLLFDIKMKDSAIRKLKVARDIEIEHGDYEEAKRTAAKIIYLKKGKDNAISELSRIIEEAIVQDSEP